MTDQLDPAEKFVEDLHSTLEQLGAPVRHSYGGLAKLTHADWPLITWVPGEITYPDEPIAAPVDTITAPIATEAQDFEVRIWGQNDLDSRTMLRNLRRASRVAGLGQRIAFGAFQWFTQQNAAHTNRGSLLIGTVTFKMPVEEQTVPIATALAVQFTVTVEFPNHSTEIIYTTGELTSG